MKATPQSAKLFVGLVTACALGFLGYGLTHWGSADLVRFACFMILTAAASRMKLSLPSLNGNMSMNVPFMLLAALKLSLAESLVIAGVSVAVQCLPKNGKSMSALQVVFNVALIVNAIGVAHLAVERASNVGTMSTTALMLAASAVAFFSCNTIPVAIVIGLAEGVSVVNTWKEICLLTFPYFVLSAGVACLAATGVQVVGWTSGTVLLLIMLAVYYSFQRYFNYSARLAAADFEHAAAAD